jgi:hypothetical protein
VNYQSSKRSGKTGKAAGAELIFSVPVAPAGLAAFTRSRPNRFFCSIVIAASYCRSESILTIEITSPSTEKIDRREKLLFYLQMPSVREYVIVSQQKMAVEVHRRQPDGRWITYYFNESDDIVEFASIELALPLTEVYRRVKFDSNAATIDY